MEAARLAQTDEYEAWIACGYLDLQAGIGTASECLRAGASIAELQAWADDLEESAIIELVDECCS